MSDRHDARRRGFLSGVAVAVLAVAGAPLRSLGQADQGIGGTGVAPSPGDPLNDEGIGGTGVIGTIRKFGSIVVNEIRITYPPDVQVTVDGKRGTAGDLKLGQVVRVVALQRNKVWSTRGIAVTSEVVGPIEAIAPRTPTAPRTMTVLGQTVSLENIPDAVNVATGQHVGVSGLRRTDGTIVASLIEPRAAGTNLVAGPVARGSDGTPMIGRLRLAGLDPSRIGGRALVQGTPAAGGLTVASARTERELLGSGVTRLSIEGYVERRGSLLRLGSGLVVNVDTKGGGGGPSRAVVNTMIDRDGRLRLESIRRSPEKQTGSGLAPKAVAPKRQPAGRPARDRDRINLRDPDQRHLDRRDLDRNGIGSRRPSGIDGSRPGGGSRGGGPGGPHGPRGFSHGGGGGARR